ncbi:sensor histidine kinase [Sphingomonas sp. PAMC 26617]|uniref:sensor histidine kinase n=1 Tax=Sphingomonas sp. PAMC 26617 TaxID=1112216 RepID=UPI000288A4FB|nr:HAMP domain-containing sensor histidine kinase [Sphingomonas sp. PAMC 26617]
MPGQDSQEITDSEEGASTSKKPFAASKTTEAKDSSSDLHQRIADLTQEIERLTEAVAARDAFLAVAAHELRNPMTPIVGRLDMLRRTLDKASKEKIEWSLDQIDWLISRFVKRATTLLDVSRLTSGKEISVTNVPVEVCELVRLIAENFRPLAQHARSDLKLDLPQAALSIMGDSLALEQVVDNLVSNAIKYAGGKPIRIRVSADSELGIARIAVSDNGPGISPENVERIFQRFERAVKPGEHSGGFGVGLWIVKQLCEAMEGTIEIESTPGAGSTFCIALPLARPKDPE